MSPSVVSHLRLVLEPMTAVSGSKRRCPTTAEENNASCDFSRSTKKSRSSGIDEGKSTGQRKKSALVKHFKPCMVNDDPLSSKPNASPTPKKSKSESSLGKPKLSNESYSLVSCFHCFVVVC